jgi:hypothetical protein
MFFTERYANFNKIIHMGYKAFLFVMAICVSSLSAQVSTPSGLVINGKWAKQIFISDVNGRPISNKYADVSGSPFFNETYKFANITLTQGRVFVNVKTRIDLAAQETYFISSNGIEAYMERGSVKEISYTDTTADDGILFYKFRTGYPTIDKQTTTNFYLVLANGRCSFLKSIIKKVSEKKSELSGEIIKDFDTYEDYYLFSNGIMKRLKRDKDFILAELSDKREQVNQFIQTNTVNVKKQEQLIKLLTYYNSL